MSPLSDNKGNSWKQALYLVRGTIPVFLIRSKFHPSILVPLLLQEAFQPSVVTTLNILCQGLSPRTRTPQESCPFPRCFRRSPRSDFASCPSRLSTIPPGFPWSSPPPENTSWALSPPKQWIQDRRYLRHFPEELMLPQENYNPEKGSGRLQSSRQRSRGPCVSP